MADDKFIKVFCGVCAKDSEIFGDGYFMTPLKYFKKSDGKAWCGCQRKYKRTEIQYTKIVQRICEEKGYVFKGFHGEFKQSLSKIKLECISCQFCWSSAIIKTLIKGHGCPCCGLKLISKSIRKNDSELIKTFLDNNRQKNIYNLKRSSDNKWKYNCIVCSNDMFVDNMLCTGVFEDYGTNLHKGQLKCRCSGKYRWTKEQREFQIFNRIILEELSYKFVEWDGEYKSAKSKFIINCEQHGKWKTDCNKFLDGLHGCQGCASSGFKNYKPAWVYILKVEGKYNFTGFGITNNLERRLTIHKHSVQTENSKIMEIAVHGMSGDLAISIEKDLKIKYGIKTIPIDGFRTEATNLENFDLINSEIQNLSQELMGNCS